MEDGFGRRVKAARALGGIDSADALAEKLKEAKTQLPASESTIKRIERGDVPSKHAEQWAAEIAKACDVPLWFMRSGLPTAEVETASELGDRMVSLHLEVMSEIGLVRNDLEAQRTTLERVERNQGGTDN